MTIPVLNPSLIFLQTSHSKSEIIFSDPVFNPTCPSIGKMFVTHKIASADIHYTCSLITRHSGKYFQASITISSPDASVNRNTVTNRLQLILAAFITECPALPVLCTRKYGLSRPLSVKYKQHSSFSWHNNLSHDILCFQWRIMIIDNFSLHKSNIALGMLHAKPVENVRNNCS